MFLIYSTGQAQACLGRVWSGFNPADDRPQVFGVHGYYSDGMMQGILQILNCALVFQNRTRGHTIFAGGIEDG